MKSVPSPSIAPISEVADAMNRKILNLHQMDGRTSTAEIARRLRRSQSSIRERI
ncbi:MAG: AsnC family transcriptional regulator [candidate division NC10 bacterium]